jgi:hypothetical protein
VLSKFFNQAAILRWPPLKVGNVVVKVASWNISVIDPEQSLPAGNRHTWSTARWRRPAKKETQMELFRNMEVVLMLSFGLVCAAACIVRPAAHTAAPSNPQARVQQVPDAPMPVVVITGKRLGAAEKRTLSGERA